MNSREISLEINEHIETLKNCIFNIDKNQKNDPFMDLVKHFDEFLCSEKTINYLKENSSELEKIREVNNLIIDVFATTFTNLANEAYKTIDTKKFKENFT